MSNENFISLYTANKVLSPKLLWNNSRLRLRHEESCLKQEDTRPFTRNNVVNLFIVYELLYIDYILKDFLFGAVKLTKNADLDKYKYSGYSIGFDLRSEFLLSDGSIGKNVIIVGDEMSSSVHIDNKCKDVLILGEGPT